MTVRTVGEIRRAPCACGGTPATADPSALAPRRAVRAHQRSPQHQAWLRSDALYEELDFRRHNRPGLVHVRQVIADIAEDGR